MSKAKPTACYIRTSTTDQHGKSQRRELERWLESQGIAAETVEWYFDHGECGDDLNRPDFERLGKDVLACRRKTVVTFKLDRLSRSLRDGVGLLCGWCERGLRVVSITEGVDFSGVVGRMIGALLFGLAELEQQGRRERQRAGIAAAKELGVYKGRAAGTTKATPRRAAELKRQGLTKSEIAAALGVTTRTVERYLKAV